MVLGPVHYLRFESTNSHASSLFSVGGVIRRRAPRACPQHLGLMLPANIAIVSFALCQNIINVPALC